MVKLIGERDTDSKAAQAMAELHLSLDHAIKRLELAVERDDLKATADPLLTLHRDQMNNLDEMLDLKGAMADTQKTWSQWLNETIATAADPRAGLDENAFEALRSSENRVLAALNDCMQHITSDPLRSSLEHMKQDTLAAIKSVDLENL